MNAPEAEIRKGPLAWMAGHSVAANLLMLILLVGGLFTARKVQQEVFPYFELDRVNIRVPYPGASPAEVERGIVLAIEEAIEGLSDIKEITATAGEGRATVTVEMIEGGDIQRLAQDIDAEVGRITSFPDEAEDPKITIATRQRYVVSLALYGNQREQVLREYAEYIRDKLVQHPAITQADLTGVRDYEISVEISQGQLRTYGLSLDEVAARIRSAAVELPGGAIKTAGGDILVRVKERRDYAREFGRLPIITDTAGTPVRLEDIATITDGFEETDRRSTYNGQPAVLLEVYRVGEQTPIEVADAVRTVVADLNRELPPGLAVELRNDRSEIYRQRLQLMLKNGYLGLGLVFLLLAIFLEARLAFWVSLGIPISFLGSLLLLPGLGVSINMVSMFAFIVTLGIVVDDAIVVGENIYYHRQQGLPWFTAAVTGVRDIYVPIVFSVLTNMIAFLPMLFIPGFMGKVFRVIPMVVICVFAISLVESLLILPAHLGHKRPRREWGPLGWLHCQQQRFSGRFLHFVHHGYGPFLKGVIRWRYLSVAIGIAILIVTIGYMRSGRLGFELFPRVESDFARASATLPFGAAFSRTAAVEQRLVTAAQAVAAENGAEDLVEGIYASANANQAQVRVYLTPPDRRPISTAEFTQLWRQRVGILAGLESLRFESDSGGPGRGFALSVQLSHQRMEILEKASAELAEDLAYYPNVSDVNDGFSPGKPQLDFQLKPAAQNAGLTAREIARQLRAAYYGAEALSQQRGRNEIQVMVRLPRWERESEFHLEEMVLQTPSGGEIPLRDAVEINRGRAYTDIRRKDGRRIVTVEADVKPRSRAGEILADLKREALPQLGARYPGLVYSFEGRRADQRESMQALIRGLLLALGVIFIMLAVPLNSYVQPAIIMSAIPFGLVGAAVGHLIMGYSLSVISMFGVVALSGVVINGSLVLVDLANRKRRAGQRPGEAIQAAAIQRFRPIVLTTLTTFGGLAPMIFETSRQARFLIPMAISLGYGILFATVITLFLVPCFYMILEDVRPLFQPSRPADDHLVTTDDAYTCQATIPDEKG
ncbi:MAG: efflux RND transporter permease subunit [Desulfosarcinaceae bacterium]|nr:efflux RND transporter permease subunit [Desulfosarcinaceae bacterium]